MVPINVTLDETTQREIEEGEGRRVEKALWALTFRDLIEKTDRIANEVGKI